MLLKLEGGIDLVGVKYLVLVKAVQEVVGQTRTSIKGLRGGPDAMSAAFVPGRILLIAPCSSFSSSSASVAGAFCVALMPGDLGPI